MRCPKDIRRDIQSIAPSKPPHELEEVVVNYYPEGSFIPPHIDNEGFLAFGVMMLEDRPGGFTYHLDGSEHFIQDKAGTFIFVDDVSLVHEVKPLSYERYSLIFLYM